MNLAKEETRVFLSMTGKKMSSTSLRVAIGNVRVVSESMMVIFGFSLITNLTLTSSANATETHAQKAFFQILHLIENNNIKYLSYVVLFISKQKIYIFNRFLSPDRVEKKAESKKKKQTKVVKQSLKKK